MSDNISFGKSDYSKLADNYRERAIAKEELKEFNEELYNESIAQLKNSLLSLAECYEVRKSKKLGDLIQDLEQTLNSIDG